MYAELGLKVGTQARSRARRSGSASAPNVSTNPAMTLGGLKEGVTPLEMAYAYSTIANHGKRVYGTFSSSKKSPVAITKVKDGDESKKNERKTVRVLPEGVANQTRGLLHQVVTSGTGTQRATCPSGPPARPAPPRTTATPGSSASPTATRWRSGSATRTSSST